MTKRLEVLQNSLEKKKARFDEKLQSHMDDVRRANGQPLNDKRNGAATMKRWELQNDSLQTLQEGIEKTQRAIENEQGKITDVNHALENLPVEIVELINEGVLNQWRRHPYTFFVDGVDKARLVWDVKKKQIQHKYTGQITDKEQWKVFARTFNGLAQKLNKKAVA